MREGIDKREAKALNGLARERHPVLTELPAEERAQRLIARADAGGGRMDVKIVVDELRRQEALVFQEIRKVDRVWLEEMAVHDGPLAPLARAALAFKGAGLMAKNSDRDPGEVTDLRGERDKLKLKLETLEAMLEHRYPSSLSAEERRLRALEIIRG